MMITSDFEGGRIELKAADPPTEGVLRIPPDLVVVTAGKVAAVEAKTPEGTAIEVSSTDARTAATGPAEGGTIDAAAIGGPPNGAELSGGEPSRDAAKLLEERPAFRQWFAFDSSGEIGVEQRFRIENAGECTWGDAFGGLYKVYASYDDETWFRVPTTFQNGALSFSHTPERERVRYAYYPPYSSARLARLLIEVPALGLGTSRALTKTERGGQLHVIEMGTTDPQNPRHIWIIAQQHPGEPMAGWFAEGLVERLCSGDEVSKALLARARLHIVPRMNPDGCTLANHRVNSLGIDLNRQWREPSVDAPEVASVREEMRQTGASFFLDAHGDERLPYVFTQLPDNHPARPAAAAALEPRFEAAMKSRSSDFQNEKKYPYMARDKPNLAIASTWAQNTFGCLAATLEMPFSDNANAPREEGWSPERSKALGSALCDVLAEMIEDLTPSRPLVSNDVVTAAPTPVEAT